MGNRIEMIEEALTGSVIGAFFEVYNELGFGFLERVYTAALEIEILSRGHEVQREVPFPVFYKAARLGTHKIDMIVDHLLIVEVKSSAVLPPIAERQVMSYLKSTKLEVALLFHFGAKPKFWRYVLTNRRTAVSALSAPSG